ncbi:MAG TPA: Rieske 2Fe-2S domain-containing protein [Acidimicrobiia bacterium]|nr:Rieske 2Fe-2S domain-containing protein [Acidimicrobiia bacterium]
MHITFLGHAGLFVETRHGSVLCDPWFTPAYFESWVPVPRNDTIDPKLLAHPDFLYVSHLHRDHFDPDWLAAHVDRRTRVLLPDFTVPYLERALTEVGFSSFVRTRNAETIDLDGLEVSIIAMNAPADGPLGDSALVLADGTTRVLNQNDARPGDIPLLQRLGPYDGHFLQFSGAIWYPVAYDFPPDEQARLAREKRINQMARARQYVEWVGAPHVFPSAGPPCFLDPALAHLNDLRDEPTNIFPDQTVFLAELADHQLTGHLVVPGTRIDLDGARCTVTHPSAAAAHEPFADKRAYLERYRADWDEWMVERRRAWSSHEHDVVAELAEWLEPLLTAAPITSAGVGGSVVLEWDDAPGTGVVIDFIESRVREWAGEPAVYRVTLDRRLVAACIERHEEDWVNSLFLSCRFTAHRDGPFNEHVMTFFKALSPDRIAHIEASHRATRRADEHFEHDGWRIQRWCPHRQADLARFGEFDGSRLTCALHHWQWDLESGRCLTSDDPDKRLHCERVADD